MATLNRVRAAWTGFPGAPGVTTIVCTDGPAMVPLLRNLFAALAPWIPSDVTIAVENTGDVFDSLTGEITGLWSAVGVAATTGSSGGGYAAAAGFRADWLTDTHLSGRLLRGRTFFVPGSGASFATDGSLEGSALSGIASAVGTFQSDAASNLVVWQRPRAAAAADGSRPAVTARSGGHAVVTSSRVPDKCTVLRSRRD